MKQCTKCKKTKPLTEFYKRPETQDGRYQQCIACVKKVRQSKKSAMDSVKFF
jgi:hypothetical protein